jgi:hypothetical protein
LTGGTVYRAFAIDDMWFQHEAWGSHHFFGLWLDREYVHLKDCNFRIRAYNDTANKVGWHLGGVAAVRAPLGVGGAAAPNNGSSGPNVDVNGCYIFTHCGRSAVGSVIRHNSIVLLGNGTVKAGGNSVWHRMDDTSGVATQEYEELVAGGYTSSPGSRLTSGPMSTIHTDENDAIYQPTGSRIVADRSVPTRSTSAAAIKATTGNSVVAAVNYGGEEQIVWAPGAVAAPVEWISATDGYGMFKSRPWAITRIEVSGTTSGVDNETLTLQARRDSALDATSYIIAASTGAALAFRKSWRVNWQFDSLADASLLLTPSGAAWAAVRLNITIEPR